MILDFWSFWPNLQILITIAVKNELRLTGPIWFLLAMGNRTNAKVTDCLN